jgi:hypothetical protein
LTLTLQRDKPREIRTPALTTTQDPEGKFLHIQDNWNVVHPLDIADLTSDGKILPMDAILLTEGDFVDVGAELDFVLSRQRHKPTTLKCFLTCTHIVRMIPAHYVQRMQLVSYKDASYFIMLMVLARMKVCRTKSTQFPLHHRKEQGRRHIQLSCLTRNRQLLRV